MPPPEARPANVGRKSAAAPFAEASEAKVAAKNPADLHAKPLGEAEASEFQPEPSRGRRRRDGGARVQRSGAASA